MTESTDRRGDWLSEIKQRVQDKLEGELSQESWSEFVEPHGSTPRNDDMKGSRLMP